MSYPNDPYQQQRDEEERRRRAEEERRRRRDSDGDLPDPGCVADAVKPCRHCGKPLRGCDGCDLFHLSVLRVFLLSAPLTAPRTRVSVPGRVGLAAIRGYQRWLSHRLPTCCPHTPSCSHYGAAVVGRYGLVQGARLAAGRISRCTGDVPRGTADPPP